MRTTVIPKELTESEAKFKHAIVEAPAKNNDATTMDISLALLTAETDFLLLLAIKDEAINEICKQTLFVTHWENLWESAGLNPLAISSKPFHENLPLKTVSCLDLLKGDYLYRQYRALIAEHTDIPPALYSQAKTYLEKAASYGCYFALNALCVNGLKQLKNMHNLTDIQMIAEQVILYAQTAATLHFTPGYLLLSNVFQEMHLHAAALYPDLPKDLQKHTFFMHAAVALCVAQRLEKYSDSAINNCYQGKTIWEACGGAYTSWLHAKIRLQSMSRQLLTLMDLDTAAQKANAIVRTIEKLYTLTPQSENTSTAESKQLERSISSSLS